METWRFFLLEKHARANSGHMNFFQIKHIQN